MFIKNSSNVIARPGIPIFIPGFSIEIMLISIAFPALSILFVQFQLSLA